MQDQEVAGAAEQSATKENRGAQRGGLAIAGEATSALKFSEQIEQQQDATEGLNVLHDAEAQDAKLPAVHDGFGHYHFLQADYENAEKQLDEAIALDPNDAAAYY
jgi:Flp pilus assembly protein TadD